MSPSKNLLILTSSQNYSWFSMTEIIPEIESLWKGIAEKNNYNVECVNVDSAPIEEVIRNGMKSDLIIVTCFNLRISKALKVLRNKLEISSPIKFYVHGMSSVGLWPLAFWGWDKFWRKNDSFLVSCRRDMDILKDKFENINVELFPFTSEAKKKELSNEKCNENISFYYIGRISEQKNIHTLLYAFSRHLEQKSNSLLTLFGKEDSLGSPNMGIESIEYEAYLKKLIRDLGIEKSVSFRGFVNREDIESSIPEGRKVFVSSSLHSDENFGMAVLQALSFGHKVILSNWGGYADFKKNYGDQVSLVSVHNGGRGPFINIKEFIIKMNSIELEHISYNDQKFHTRENLITNYDLNLFQKSQKVCDFSFAEKIVKIRESFSTDILSSRIFENYGDPLFHYFSEKYSSSSSIDEPEDGSYTLLPWVSIDEKKVTIADPHKGEIVLDIKNTEQTLKHLFNLGYALCE